MLKPNRPLMISLEGNIGAGKTTILEYLATLNNITILNEPIDQWCNFNNNNLFKKMYNNEITSMSFQSYVQTTRFNLLNKTINTPILIVERSLLSNEKIFLKKDLNEGKITKIEIDILHENEKLLNNFIHTKPDVIFYLKTNPEVAYNRIKIRKRKEENNVTLQLIEDLHTLHENWLNPEQNNFVPNYKQCNNLTIETFDANINLSTLKTKINEKIQTYQLLHTLEMMQNSSSD